MRPYFEDPGHFNDFFDRWRWFQRGLLPDRGGVYDQANAFVEYARVAAKALDDAEENVRKKNESASNLQAHQGRMNPKARPGVKNWKPSKMPRRRC